MVANRTTTAPQLRLVIGDEAPPSPKPKKKAPERKSRLPDDWEPSEPDLAYAESRGLRGERLALEVEKFKNYWHGNGETKMRWAAVWRTWVLNCNSWGPRGGGSPGSYSRTL